jgi:hypothetical protein
MKVHKVLLLATIVLTAGCKHDDPEPEPETTDLISNGDAELGTSAPTPWVYSGNLSGRWSNDTFRSPARSLQISTDVLRENEGAFWAQKFCNNIPTGKRLTLRAHVKGKLIGNGVSVVLRCDRTSTPGGPADVLEFATTEGTTPISGEFDWKEYSVQIASVPEGTVCIWIFLAYLPGTTGTVYFDDVSVRAQ